MTQSGSNQWHGSALSFCATTLWMRRTTSIRVRRRHFSATSSALRLGGPIQKDKTFLFANYEGFRQNLHQTSAAFVPDARVPRGCRAERSTLAESVAHASRWRSGLQTAIADEVFSSPLQTIREDFGTVRMDHIFSDERFAGGIYTIDDGGDVTATPVNPYSSDILNLREQVVSIEETHVFSPSLLNTARVGYSRAGYFFTGEPTPGTPAASVPGFLSGRPVGAVVVGGSAASNPQASIGLGGQQQRQQSAHRAQSIHLRRSRHADAGAATSSVSARGSSNSSPTKTSRSANTGRRRSPVWRPFCKEPPRHSCTIRRRRR